MRSHTFIKIKKMKKILIPTDFSSNAKDALLYTLGFLKGQAADIQLVNVVRPIMVDTIDSAMVNAKATELVVEQTEKNLETIRELIEQNPTEYSAEKIKLSTRVKIGDVIAEINKAAADHNAELIVLGTRGEGYSLSDKVLGTISTKLIKSASCPLMLIPKGYAFDKLDNLVFATNLDTGDPYELNRALKMLQPYSPLVNVIYVKHPYTDQELDTRVDSFAKYMIDHSPAIKTTFHIEPSREVETSLSDYVLKENAELLVMHRTQKGFINRLLNGSHTKKIVSKTTTPLLILN